MHSRDFPLKERLPAALEVPDYLKRRRSLSYKTVTKPRPRYSNKRVQTGFFFSFNPSALLSSPSVCLPSIVLELTSIESLTWSLLCRPCSRMCRPQDLGDRIRLTKDFLQAWSCRDPSHGLARGRRSRWSLETRCQERRGRGRRIERWRDPVWERWWPM